MRQIRLASQSLVFFIQRAKKAFAENIRVKQALASLGQKRISTTGISTKVRSLSLAEVFYNVKHVC